VVDWCVEFDNVREATPNFSLYIRLDAINLFPELIVGPSQKNLHKAGVRDHLDCRRDTVLVTLEVFSIELFDHL